MIFVDSGAWIALVNRRDQHHNDAVETFNNLVQQKTQLLTTDYVIAETANRLRDNHLVAVQFLDLIKSSKATGALTVVKIDSVLFQEAERALSSVRYRKVVIYRLHQFCSLSACIISLRHLRFDQHFPMVGITLRG